jgi:glycosyltransferase involved in cell wall biosynthesis
MTVHAAGMYFLDSSPFHEGLIEYIVSRYAVHYVAVSNAVVGYLQKYGNIPSGKITLIHNGIDPERICRTDIRNRDDVRESLGFEKHHFIVISVGRLIPVKGFEILLREFSAFSKKAPDARLLIVGYGPEEDKIRKTIGDLKLNDRIKIIGRYDKLAELHNASDCFVMTSRQEGFGLAILEAMACGLPVIGSNVGAVPEMIEDRVNGLIFSTKNDGELALCISKIYENRNGARSMGDLARKTALEKYHIKNTSKKYEELYRRLL